MSITNGETMQYETEEQSESWRVLAQCRDIENPDDLFFKSGDAAAIRAAKRICETCVVVSACLEYALENDEKFGVWGGLSEKELQALKNRQKRLAHPGRYGSRA